MSADDEKKLLEDARKLPLEQRVDNKNWKVRSEALDHIQETCARAFSSEDSIFSEAGPLFKALVADTNANNVDKALETLCVFLGKANEEQAARIASSVCHTIASKALKGRPGTVAKAAEACLLFVELEQQASVVEGIMKAFTDKVPKVVVAALDIVLKCISSFGTKVIDAKAIMKGLPTVFGNSNNEVRNKAKEIVVELAAYLGSAVVSAALLEKMPAAMKKDVEKLLDELPPGKRQRDRLTRQEQAAREVEGDEPEPMEVDGEGAVAAVQQEDGVDPELDPYEFATPQDILGPLSKDTVVVGDDKILFWDSFESKKWAIRKKALEKIKTSASVSRLAPGDYGDMIREVKKILQKDANVNCAAEAANAAGALASGLRKDFTSGAKALAPAILERFKEKNIVMSKAAEESLRALFQYCITVVDAAEDLVAALEHKNPKVRLDTAKLVKEVLDGTSKPLVMKVQGSVLPALAKLALDSDAGIRDAAQASMVVFAVKAGSMGVLDKVMSKLDDSRKKKVEEMVQEAVKSGLQTDKKLTGTSIASRPNASTAARPNPPLAPRNINAARPSVMAAAVASKGGAPNKRSTTSGSSASMKPKAASTALSLNASGDDEPMLNAPKLSNEELEEQMVQLFGSATVDALRSAKWQERLEAMSTVVGKVEELAENLQPNMLMQAVGFLPGWNEKNFQVLNKCFDLVTNIATQALNFSKRDAIFAMDGLAEKVHEMKHKEKVFEALSVISEAVGPMYVMTLLHKRAAANKNPKVLSEALVWMAEAVQAFGLATMNVKTIIDWMKADLGSASAPVRNRAMEVLGKCHAQLGSGLVDFLEGLKPAQIAALEEHFKKNPQTEVCPTRKLRKARKAGGAFQKIVGDAAVEGEDDEAMPSADELLPRTDISSRITPSLISMLQSSNWKERNAGVLEVEIIIKEANNRIAPNVGDLLGAMKGRLADSNRNLAAKALMVVGDIARAMGPAFDKQGRMLLGPAVANISDNKKQVRDAVLSVLDSWISVVPADRVFPALLEAMSNPKCIVDGKVAGLLWMTKTIADGKGSKCVDFSLRAVALGTQDKAASVREAGNTLFAELIKFVDKDSLQQASASLDSATRKHVQDLLSKTVGAAALAASAAVVASSRSSTAGPKSTDAPGRGMSQRPATSRGSVFAPSLSRSTSASSNVADQQPKGAILALSVGKSDRAKKYRPRPGKFDGLNSEEIEILEKELGVVASDDFRSLLFSKDFKRHLEAADMLVALLPELFEEIKASLDLLFRWVVLRICDGNMQTLVKVLELCKTILEALIKSQCPLTDYECAILLPCVVEKSGHNQDRVRALHRDVLGLSCSLLSPAKVLDYILLGLSSKSNRTKIECCEEIGCIIQREGMGPLQFCKGKPVASLAQLLTERDGATRSAALATIEHAWVEEGDGIWKLLGRMETRERDMVEDRLKRSKLQPKAREAAPVDSTPNRRRPLTGATVAIASVATAISRQEDSIHLECSRPAFTPPAVLETPVPGRPGTGLPLSALAFGTTAGSVATAAPTPVPPSRPATASEADLPLENLDEGRFKEQWMHAMFGINSDNMPDVIESMKMLCGDLLAMAMADLPGIAVIRATIALNAVELFTSMNRLIPKLLDVAEADALVTGEPPSSRACKYALNVLLQGFMIHEVATALPQGTLRETISLLLLLLLNERGIINYDEGSTLLKAINVLMLKIMETTNRTYAFAALLQLLRNPPEEVKPDQMPKFNDLVVKCLIKLTKSMQVGMEGIDLQDLLLSLHDFFMYLGVDEIRKRSSSDDKPLRMVKTILHELCKMQGYGIYEFTHSIPGRNSDPQPIIFAYISLNLQTLAQSGIIQSPSSSEAQRSASATSLSGRGSDESGGSQARGSINESQKTEVKAKLKDIMCRLMNLDQHAEAMEELYWLRKDHSIYVEKYLSNAKVSENFLVFINSGLAEVEQRLADGGASPIEVEEAKYRPALQVPRLELQSSVPAQTSPSGSASRLTRTPSPGARGPERVAQTKPVFSPQLSDRGPLSGRSDGSQSARLSGVRERLSQLRMSADGMPSPGRVELSGMRSSIEELQVRMQNLRRSTQN